MKNVNLNSMIKRVEAAIASKLAKVQKLLDGMSQDELRKNPEFVQFCKANGLI